jgi:hypothetical protein
MAVAPSPEPANWVPRGTASPLSGATKEADW